MTASAFGGMGPPVLTRATSPCDRFSSSGCFYKLGLLNLKKKSWVMLSSRVTLKKVPLY